jgi:transcriptional regulator with XRE-family HTH domain
VQFGTLLRSWRQARHFSQLDLAGEAEVSARHISFLETGRAQPSRDMVMRLADVLDVPLRERNALLQAAGFAAGYRQTELSAPELAAVRRSLEFLLERHAPYPAVLVDRHWNLRLANRPAMVLLPRFVDAAALQPPINVVRLLFRADGFRPHVVNWDEVAASLVDRLHREATLAATDPEARALLDEALATGAKADPRAAPAQPIIPIHLRRGDLELRIFSAITTLGTPADVTLQELRLETFFPADEASDAALRKLVA